LFLAGSLLLIRWTFDVNSAEIVVQKLSSMVPSTALGLVTAGVFLLALLHEVEIDGSQFPLIRPDLGQTVGLFAGVLAPEALGYKPGVPRHDGPKYGDG
jgi:hypothetical protein